MRKFLLLLAFVISCTPTPERQLTQTEYAAYNYCKQYHHYSCMKDTIRCSGTDESSACAMNWDNSYPITTTTFVNNHPIVTTVWVYDYRPFTCTCKNLVCQ